MKESTRTATGYACFGFLMGILLLPGFYLWSTRSNIAQTPNPVWVFIFYAIVFVPTLAGAVIGHRKGTAASFPA